MASKNNRDTDLARFFFEAVRHTVSIWHDHDFIQITITRPAAGSSTNEDPIKHVVNSAKWETSSP